MSHKSVISDDRKNIKPFIIEGLTPCVNTHSGCDYHRIILPLTYMGIDISSFKDRDPVEVLEKTKLLIFNRAPTAGIEGFLYYRKKFGYKIVCDVDDYWELYPNHVLYKSWYENRMNENIIRSIISADMVFTTTNLLADKVRKLNKNVEVVPNALPYDNGQFNSQRTESEDVRILYAGGSSHYHDLKTISRAIERVNNNPSLSKCRFILGGYSKSSIWDRIESVFTLNSKLKNYERRNSLPLESYMDHYTDADISLAPLENNYFNTFKSNLKILEAGCKNIPCIVSNMSPYSDDEELNNSVFPARNNSEWYTCINMLTTVPEAREYYGKKLGEIVRKKYNLFKINELRKQVFEYLINK